MDHFINKIEQEAANAKRHRIHPHPVPIRQGIQFFYLNKLTADVCKLKAKTALSGGFF
jgi:hypothetical protein